MWLFLAVPWVCLQFVIVVFSDHTNLLFLNLSFQIYQFLLQERMLNGYKSLGIQQAFSKPCLVKLILIPYSLFIGIITNKLELLHSLVSTFQFWLDQLLISVTPNFNYIIVP